MTVPVPFPSGAAVVSYCSSCDALKGQLINELRTAANNITVSQAVWTVSQELKRIANVLDGAASGSVTVPIPTAGTLVNQAPTRSELAMAIDLTRAALDRQPTEPTPSDAVEVLAFVLRTGVVPLRWMVAPPGFETACSDGCPAEHIDGHTHNSGRIAYT